MNTLSSDLLGLIDKHLDAKSSALLAVNEGLELFSNGYDLFNISQTKWLLYAIYNNHTEEEQLFKHLDCTILNFILEHKCFDFHNIRRYDIDVKFIKESKLEDVDLIGIGIIDCKDYLSNIYGVQEVLNAYIERDCIEMVKILAPHVIKRYGTNYNEDDLPNTTPSIITVLLTEAYKYKSTRCIEYFQEYYNQMNPIDIDKYYILIELLSYDVYDNRTIKLLSELIEEPNRIYLEVLLKFAVFENRKKTVYCLLDIIGGFNFIIDNPDTLSSLIDWFKFASKCDDKNLLKLVVNIIVNSGNNGDICDIFMEALYSEEFDICDTILANCNWMLEEFQYHVSNTRELPYIDEYTNDSEHHNGEEEGVLAGSEFGRFLQQRRRIQIEYMTVKVFDYITSRCICNFDLNYIRVCALKYLNYQLFKRVVDFEMQK